jgi:Family of unknown function (DUF6082)
MDEMDMNESQHATLSGYSTDRRFLRIRKGVPFLAAFAVFAGILSLVLISPLLLRQLGHVKGIDWSRLSNIGQTYGAATAILSAVALIGVSLSLIVQTRQAKEERLRVVRERHMELLRIVLDSPDLYGPVLGILAPRSADEARQFLFATMWMNYARMGYQMGILDEQAIREEILQSAFGEEPLRKWWAVAGKYWNIGAGSDRRARQFTQITNDEYDRAMASGPPIARAAASSPSGVPPAWQTVRWGIPASMAVGIAIGALLTSRFRNRRP